MMPPAIHPNAMAGAFVFPEMTATTPDVASGIARFLTLLGVEVLASGHTEFLAGPETSSSNGMGSR